MKFSHDDLEISKSLIHMSEKNVLVEAAETIIKSVGEDTEREGLKRTPERFAKAIKEICSGYQLTAREAVGNGIFVSEGHGLVSVKAIEYFSMCEHHMLPFWGHANVAYYPKGKIIGLSKIPRLVDVFSKRLQVQERLTREIAVALQELIDARAVVVKITGCHMCMMMRGVKKTGSETVTEFAIGMGFLTDDEKQRIWKSVE